MGSFGSLLKAMLSQDMDFFKYNVGKNSSKLKKMLFPIVLAIIVMIAVGTYAYMFAEALSAVGMTFIVLTLYIATVTIITFVEGIYKSQGILFECKDNDLLFSLPIKKSKIFALRVMKLLIFQFIYNLFFIVPAFVVYAYFESPGVNFYLMSVLMLFLLPLIPTAFAVIFGYIVKSISSRFKSKRIVQTFLSIVILLGVFFLGFNLEDLISNLVQNAATINEVIARIYYPAGAYLNLINEFDFVELVKLLAVNIIPLIFVIYIGSINYFKIISKSKGMSTKEVKVDTKEYVKVRTPMKTLVKKELNRFFSSPVYMLNTSFGVFMMLAISIALCVNSDGLIQMFTNNEELSFSLESIYEILPKIFLQLIVFVGSMTSITSSSISLEGKSFNVTKSLPVKTEKILLAKVISSDIISLPLMLLSDLIFIVKFSPSLENIFEILLLTIIIPTLTALIGLLVNLKYPKMNASSDTEVVKQSMSTMISVFIGMIIFIVSVVLMVVMFENINEIMPIEICVLIVTCVVLWKRLKLYGEKRFKEINV